MSPKGQSLEDKLYAAKYFISGQTMSFVVIKATTSELLGPKKKHLSYLVAITDEPNVSIPKLAKYLMLRAKHLDWTVSFKSLITIHYLMDYGNERFIQNLASSNVNQRLFESISSSFIDRSTSQSYSMSTFLRRHARYLGVKIYTYRCLGLDFCRIKANSNQTPIKMKNMKLDRLMTTLPVLQSQLDTLLAFDATDADLSNGIINSAFALLYKDFVKLYIIYQSAIIRLLELFFETKENQLKRAQNLLETYKKFLVRMHKVTDFMRVIDSVGLDTSDMPNLIKSPNLPDLKKLEDYYKSLEGTRLNTNSFYGLYNPNDLLKLGGQPLETNRSDKKNVIKQTVLLLPTQPPSQQQKRKRHKQEIPSAETIETVESKKQTGVQALDDKSCTNDSKKIEEDNMPDLMVLVDDDDETNNSTGRQSSSKDQRLMNGWVQVEL